ncbi:IclR family transcriptional regulator [Amycolatopsis sp. CA-230715]|uniref:IclR family transcriptional regulator n=1 Tax=Amycolatopsis sp. CA-230715 TaxID=2745196 RepID=UPI001C320871|nr:IclR family transcriptional regulator [Amycolatopsis sp. CA-230715]QWF84902.1 HTH-type transcriptional regulator KipR [Amycolatopsis sp. CA-230715]
MTTILELAAADSAGVRLAELADHLGAPRSSVHGLVKGLVATGYLRDDGGTYTIGPAVGALLAAAPPTVGQAAKPAMQQLVAQFGETVMLASLIGDSVVYTETVESTQMIRYSAPLRTRRPLYPTSSGKCILAFATGRFRENYLATHLADDGQRERVARELAEIAEAGVAINRGETMPDVYGVGVPIVHNGRVMAVIAVAGPSNRMRDNIGDIAEAAKVAAHEVAARMAGQRSAMPRRPQ